MPKTDWIDNDIATAALMNQIEDQIVVQCTAATRPAGVHGQMIYQTDTDELYVYDGTQWELLTSSTWVPFTPQWVNLTVGNGTTSAAWVRFPGGAYVKGVVNFGSSTSVSGAVSVDMGANAAADGIRNGGVCYVFDASSGSNYDGLSIVSSGASDIALFADNDNVTNSNPINNGFATGDSISFHLFVAFD